MEKEKDKKILEIFKEIIPFLTELEKERIIGFGEGLIHKNRELNS